VCPLGDALEVVRDEHGAHWTRCTCGFILAPAGENWREYAGHEVAPPAEISRYMRLNPAMEIRRYSCPGCGRLHAVDVRRKDAPDLHDVHLSLQT
jgi:N-methylhydantoinase B